MIKLRTNKVKFKVEFKVVIYLESSGTNSFRTILCVVDANQKIILIF